MIRQPRLSWIVVAAVASLVAVSPVAVRGQEAPNVYTIEEADGTVRDLRTLRAQASRFQLFGQADRAVTSLRSRGRTAYGRGMEYFTTNTGIIDAADVDMDSQPDMATASGGAGQWFDVSPIYAASKAEWERFVALVPSLALATGGGWAVSRNFPTIGLRELFATDGQLGTAFPGVQSTADGTCLDLTSTETSNIAPGLTLLAASDCPPTWPLVNGTPTFRGGRRVPSDAYLSAQAAQGNAFAFDWWRVDPTRVEGARHLGDNVSTYGAYDDYNSAMIGRFGAVVPGGDGEPAEEGWLLGLRTEFDAFTFNSPLIANSMFWRAIIINETEQVYGVGLDYEDLYVGYTFQPIRTSDSSFYLEVWRGALLSAERGTGNPQCPGVAPPDALFIDCAGDPTGFRLGATAQVVLKSPIGDLRNVLFTCDPAQNAQRIADRAIPCPTGEFFDPSNVHAGDTITYNHFVMCPFGITCSSHTLTGPDRQMFGALASNLDDYLNGRDPASLGADERYSVFRNPNYPQQPTPFSFWVPGSWDYSANGATPGSDTIFVPTCYGPPGVVIQGTTRENREDACVVTWADTMPVGELGNPAYNNSEGIVSYWSVGPFALAAGDTTALVIALVAEADSAAFEHEVNEVIEHYLRFYPAAAPPPLLSMAAVDVKGTTARRLEAGGKVSFFWESPFEDYLDPFLEEFADRLATATGGRPARLRDLNPGLEAAIRERARDNIEAILVYKSCDGGRSFTADDTDANGRLDCDGEPTRSTVGQPVDAGWEAYAVLAPDATTFVDTLVQPGQSYLYAFLARTRGARFLVVDSIGGALTADTLSLAPPLLHPLVADASQPNVVDVYVPTSAQAGGRTASATSTGPDPAGSTAPFELSFIGDDAVGGTYRASFANRFVVTEFRPNKGPGASTVVVAADEVFGTTPILEPRILVLDSLRLTTANPNGVTLAGDIAQADTVSDADGATISTTLEDFGFVLYKVAEAEPLLVSTILDGERTTPALPFITRQAAEGFTGFPGFIVQARNTHNFAEQSYSAGDRHLFAESGTPSVIWDTARTRQASMPGTGTYEITWVDAPFGPGAPFTLDPEDPEATRSAFAASLAEREVGQTGRVDAEAGELLGHLPDELAPVKLPFTVRNATFDRTVDVAMVRTARSLVLTGPGDATELSIEVPEDQWIPGDELFFIETVEVDSTVFDSSVGRDALVLTSGLEPIRNTRTTVTIDPAIIGCGDAPRTTCNPVADPETRESAYRDVRPGQILSVEYHVPFDSLNSELEFDVLAPLSGDAVLASGNDLRAQMDSIRVVPNPFVVISEYQIGQAEKRIMFTHLPPEGTLRIFTVSGHFVQEVKWGPGDLAGNGDLFYDLKTREGHDIASGLFVFTVQARNPASGRTVKKVGKFVVIR